MDTVDEIVNNLSDISVEIFSIRDSLFKMADSIEPYNLSAYTEVKTRLSEAVMLIDDSIAIMVDELEAKLEDSYDL